MKYGVQHTGSRPVHLQEEAGTLFDIKYMKNYKVIEYTTSPELEGTPLTAATYILHQCGTERPDDEFIQSKIRGKNSSVQFVEIPLTAVATEDSTVGWMLVRVPCCLCADERLLANAQFLPRQPLCCIASQFLPWLPT
jgi:hypothetical protein